MAVIEQRIRLVGSKGSKDVVALFDSGVTYSCVRPDLARRLERVVPIPGAMKFSTAKKGETLTARERISVNFYVNGFRLSDEFMVIPGLIEPVTIGAATMQKWRMKLDFEHDRVIIDPRVTKLRLLRLRSPSSGSLALERERDGVRVKNCLTPHLAAGSGLP